MTLDTFKRETAVEGEVVKFENATIDNYFDIDIDLDSEDAELELVKAAKLLAYNTSPDYNELVNLTRDFRHNPEKLVWVKTYGLKGTIFIALLMAFDQQKRTYVPKTREVYGCLEGAESFTNEDDCSKYIANRAIYDYYWHTLSGADRKKFLSFVGEHVCKIFGERRDNKAYLSSPAYYILRYDGEVNFQIWLGLEAVHDVIDKDDFRGCLYKQYNVPANVMNLILPMYEYYLNHEDDENIDTMLEDFVKAVSTPNIYYWGTNIGRGDLADLIAKCGGHLSTDCQPEVINCTSIVKYGDTNVMYLTDDQFKQLKYLMNNAHMVILDAFEDVEGNIKTIMIGEIDYIKTPTYYCDVRNEI